MRSAGGLASTLPLPLRPDALTKAGPSTNRDLHSRLDEAVTQVDLDDSASSCACLCVCTVRGWILFAAACPAYGAVVARCALILRTSTEQPQHSPKPPRCVLWHSLLFPPPPLLALADGFSPRHSPPSSHTHTRTHFNASSVQPYIDFTGDASTVPGVDRFAAATVFYTFFGVREELGTGGPAHGVRRVTLQLRNGSGVVAAPSFLS